MWRGALLVISSGCNAVLGIASFPPVSDASAGGRDGSADAGTDTRTDAATDAPSDAASIQFCTPSYEVLPEAQTFSTYKRVTTNNTWVGARDHCRAEGAILAIPETMAEGLAIFDLVRPPQSSPYAWIGLSDTNRDAILERVDGGTFTGALVWGPNEPTGNADYILLGTNGQFFDWNDTAEGFACECPPMDF